MALIGYHTLIDRLYRVLRNDYAGFAEKGDWAFFGPRSGIFATDSRINCDNDLDFLLACRRLLENMAEPNLRISTSHDGVLGDRSLGFDVRATADRLYVTSVTLDTRLHPGDCILSLDGRSIKELRRSVQAFRRLHGSEPEREIWMGMLKDSFHADVLHADGTEEDLKFLRFPPSGPLLGSAGAGLGSTTGTSTTFRMLRQDDGCLKGDVAFLRIESFDDPAGLQALLRSHAQDIAGSRRLVIDVREGHDGIIDGFLPLLPYVCRTPVTLTGLVGPQQVYVNYTQANCERMAQQLLRMKDGLVSGGASQDILALLDGEVSRYRQMSGSGMVLEDDTDWDDLDFTIDAAAGPDDVVVLTDLLCRDAAELFVRTARNSPAVRLVGRATMGSIDYSMPVDYVLDEYFTFTYSMAKTKDVATGKRDSVDGIPADVHIPWTPDECMSDLVLKAAVTL